LNLQCVTCSSENIRENERVSIKTIFAAAAFHTGSSKFKALQKPVAFLGLQIVSSKKNQSLNRARGFKDMKRLKKDLELVVLSFKSLFYSDNFNFSLKTTILFFELITFYIQNYQKANRS